MHAWSSNWKIPRINQINKLQEATCQGDGNSQTLFRPEVERGRWSTGESFFEICAVQIFILLTLCPFLNYFILNYVFILTMTATLDRDCGWVGVSGGQPGTHVASALIILGRIILSFWLLIIRVYQREETRSRRICRRERRSTARVSGNQRFTFKQ